MINPRANDGSSDSHGALDSLRSLRNPQTESSRSRNLTAQADPTNTPTLFSVMHYHL